MNKILRCAAVAAMAIGFNLPTLSQADAANVVMLPLVNNVVEREDLGAIYFDRAIETSKQKNDFEIIDGKEVDQAIEKNTKQGVLADEAALKEIAAATGADVVFGMQIDEVSREDITVFNAMEQDMIVRCNGVFVYYNAMTGKYKLAKVMEEDRMPMSLGARYDIPGEMFGNSVTNNVRRALGIKKIVIEKPRISKGGFKGNM